MVDPVRQLVRVSRRRWIAWRLLERVATTLAVAGVASLPFATAMTLWRRNGTLLLLVVPLLAALASAWATWRRRPSELDTAQAIDDQFQLRDLLSTALRLDRGDPWADAVLTRAREASRAIPPASLAVRRIGGRGWGGIGAAASATLLTLAVLASADHLVATPVDADRRADRLAAWKSLGLDPASIDLPRDHRRSASASDRRISERASGADASRVETAGPERSTASSDRSSPGTGGGFSPGDGRRETPSDSSSARPPTTRDERDPSGSSGGRGDGEASTDAARSSDPSSGRPSGVATAGGDDGPRPFGASDDRIDPENLNAAAREGRLPPAAIEVVRRYFRRDR